MKTKIGLFGFGCVGKGVYDNVQRFYQDSLEIKKIAVKDINKKRDGAPASLFTNDKNELIQDPEIDLIIEVIDNSPEAAEIIVNSLRAGKGVVSANKSAIANNFNFFLSEQKKAGQTLLYEGAVAAAIPILRLLETHYADETITEVEGILNGSTNYLLSKLRLENKSFEFALEEAQRNGFAESNPTLDIDGWDASFKLVILTAHAFGYIPAVEEVRKATFAGFLDTLPDLRKKWKSISKAAYNDRGGIDLTVQFKEIDEKSSFQPVEYELNAVRVHSAIAGTNTLYGKGAGADATASAVLSDVFQWKKGFRYNYAKYELYKEQELV